MEMLKLNCDPPRTYFRYGLVTLLSLLTVPTLFAQQTSDSSDVSALKAQMEKMQQQNQQMQKEYEDRISTMESKMQSLESKADSGTILNTRVLTDDNGKQYEGKGPVLDESFLKSLTRNFSFTAYVRAGVQFNGSGGGGNFNFEAPDNDGGRWRLGNENDTYMELTWKQAHLLGDSPDVMDVDMVFTPRFEYDSTKTTSNSQFAKGAVINLRQAYVEAKNFIKSAPEVTVWAGQRFLDRHDIHIHDYFFDDYSGYGMGVDNIDLGFGKLLVSYLGGIKDDIAESNGVNQIIQDPTKGGLYMHTLDVRIHDIDLAGGKLELLTDYQFFKGGVYKITSPAAP